MANKDLKIRTPISNSVKTESLDSLKYYSNANDTRIPLSKLLDKAITLFLKSTEK